jgi:HEPN domain-containing protein
VLASNAIPLLDTAVYHCQQAAEKAFKAFLVLNERNIDKTHDLGLLVKRCSEIDVAFDALRDDADLLSPFATLYRYPGLQGQPDESDARDAIRRARLIVEMVRRKM